MKVEQAVAKEQLVEFYRKMFLIREFEERAAEQYMLGKIRGFLHLYIGEEAIAVGGLSVLREQDYVVTHYRDHGHAIAKGMDPKAIMAEVFGKATGCSKGKGGSMHLFDAERNFMGGYAIVGGHLPLASGLALAAAYRGEDRVAVAILGDGALNEGEFHEVANLAAVWNLPMVFLIENNLYGMGAPVWATLALHDEIYKLAESYRMPGVVADGMDVLAMREAMRKAVEWCRQGKGPYLIEAKTYRFRGHSMADPAKYRQEAEVEEWLQRDPLPRYRSWLLENHHASEKQLKALEEEVVQEVAEAVRFAEESPPPAPEALYEDVYTDS